MDEEDAIKNVTQKEKKIKSKSKKGEKSEVDATEHVQASGKQEIAEMKKDHKKNKRNKTKRSNDVEFEIEKGSKKMELSVASGDDRSRDPADNVERKMKRREKNKFSHSKEVGKNERRNGESLSKMNNTNDCSKEKKKHTMKRKLEDVDFEEVEIDGNLAGEHSHNERKKRKKEKKKIKDDSSLLQQEKMPDNVDENIEVTEHDGNDGKELKKQKKKKEKKKNNIENSKNGLLQIDELDYAKKKKKHAKLIESGVDDLQDKNIERERTEQAKPVEKDLTDVSPSIKKVRFSGQDEIFTIPGNSNRAKANVDKDDLESMEQFPFDEENECVGEDGLIRGKRFSPDEDIIVKAAVLHYIDKNYLGEDGLKMVLNSKSCPKVRGCWKEIGSAIPYRPYTSVYYRAKILFQRSETRKWTQEDYDIVRSYVKEHGNNWKALADELGRHRFHVKDTWRRIKLNQNKGRWSQDEYQKLFNLVNTDLQAKLTEDKVSKHGMLRDNICWTAISDELSSRSQANCCIKWYNQLTSRMVADGVWADTDDYRLIGALYELDATCAEDVDWDDLLENRTGDLCRKRWNQMVLHIGHHGNKSFSEQVEVLAQRYCPVLLAARETWDSKPRVSVSNIRRKSNQEV